MWYVVKVQSGREESIKEAIERRVKIEGLEAFFGQILIPTEKETILQRNKRITREKKKFPGYIMAKVEFNHEILYLFRETAGVGDFVGGGPNQPPLPMTPLEVQRMIGDKDKDGPGKTKTAQPDFSTGDRVKIKDGVFSGMEGEVKEILEAKEQVRVEVQVLGRNVSVEMEYWQVEPT
jgi:transcriptional antiterminator NusG